MATKSTPTRKIRFLSRSLTFPTDPTFREYRMVEDLTGVKADDIMTGQAGVWMLPVLAIVAMMRADKNATHETLSKILDLNANDITLEGDFGDVDSPPDEEKTEKSTGTKNTTETPEESGTPA